MAPAFATLARGLRMAMPTAEPSTTLRWAFYLGGLLCISAVRIFDHFVLGAAQYNPVVHNLGILALLLASLVLFFLASRSTIPAVLHGLLDHSRPVLGIATLGALLLVPRSLVLIAHIPAQLARPQHYQLDSIAMVDCGTRLLLHGRNPYTAFNLVACLTNTGVPRAATTPLQAGAFAHVASYPTLQQLIQVFTQVSHHLRWPVEFESHFSYPAGSVIFPAPIIALGWPEISLFFLLCLLLTYALLAWWAPPRLSPWLVLLALANITVWEYAVGIDTDSLVVLLILGAWATWRRGWVSALLMGLAIATRQNAWFVVPFYAILIGSTYGRRTLAKRLGVMGAVFVLLNGAFFLQSPLAWTDGVFGQLIDPMFSIGSGLIAVADLGWLPLWPRATYTVLELVALLGCTLFYARTCRQHPGTAFVLALVPLVFAWRSPLLYLVPLTVLCLWPLVADLHARNGACTGTTPALMESGEPSGGGDREINDVRTAGRSA